MGAARERPNILFLMTDQQRYDSLGCYGFQAAHTPNLDRLATEGVVFEHDYVNNPICTPSRASMFTGKHLPGHGVYRLYDNLPLDEVLFTERLQDAGYETALFGKLHVSGRVTEASERHPHDGFDIYEWCLEGGLCMDSPFQAYAQWLKRENPGLYERFRRNKRGVKNVPAPWHMTRWVSERTIAFLKGRRNEGPFFCMASIFDPHNPYDDYPLEMANLVDPLRIPDPLIQECDFRGKPEALLREHHGSVMKDFGNYTLDELRQMRLGYHASVAFADQEFGRVLDTLEETGMAENTLVIFTSDHGDMLGDHQLLAKGAFFYDPCVRVPLLMRWPDRFGGGRRVPALVQNHDLAATVLAAAGIAGEVTRAAMPESRDLTPLAGGETDKVHEEVVCCYRNSGLSSEPSRTPYFDAPIHATMIRDGRYKLNVWHEQNGRDFQAVGELYDMDTDPQELWNLWAVPEASEARSRLTARLSAWLERHETPDCGSRGGERLPNRT